MKKLSREKRQQLVLVVLVTAGVLAGLGWGLIRSQQLNLGRLAERKAAAQAKLQSVKQTIESADRIETELAEQGKRLDKAEETMAAGDLYAWAINTLRQFKLPYKVEIPQFSQIDGPKPMPMFPQFPYQQASLTIGGTAQFYDFGRFLADFENQFPYIRVQNLVLEPSAGESPAGQSSGGPERLAFRLEISALVRPASS